MAATQTSAHSTRRDARYPVRSGEVRFSFEYCDRVEHRGALTTVSYSGLAFRLGENIDFPDRAVIVAAIVQVGDLVIEGDLVPRFAGPAADGSIEYGCTFNPATPDDLTRWVALVTGAFAAIGS